MSNSDIVYTKGGDNNCSHNYAYYGRGVDGLPIYECSKCGAHQKRWVDLGKEK